MTKTYWCFKCGRPFVSDRFVRQSYDSTCESCRVPAAMKPRVGDPRPVVVTRGTGDVHMKLLSAEDLLDENDHLTAIEKRWMGLEGRRPVDQR